MLNRLSAAMLAGLCLSAQAVTISLTPSKDNTLFESPTGDVSSGLGSLFAGVTASGTKHRALMAFDLSSIPAGATINSASLGLTVTKAGFGGASVFSLYPVLADWGEGTSNSGSGGGGAVASTGDATWVHRFYNTDAWTTAGGDFSGTPAGGVSMGAPGSVTIPNLASSVQSWIASPATNFGWILKSDESVVSSSLRLDSRESLTVGTRPTLTIDYTVASGASNWLGDSDGEWSDSARWSASVPNAAGAEAVLGAVNSTTRSIHLDGIKTVGTLTIDSPQKYQITGTSALNFDASGGAVYLNVLQGSHDIQAPLTAAAGKEVRKTGNGSVQLKTVAVDSLRIDAGTVSIAANAGTVSLKTLNLTGGKLDLKNNSLRLDDGVASARVAVRDALLAGSLNSSSLASGFALGYLEPGSTRVDVLPLLAGDIDGNGKVNTVDFNTLAGNFGGASLFWQNGDLNYNGSVDSTDFGLLAGNYGKTAAPGPLGSTVPEPASAIALFGLIALQHRRSRLT